VRGNGRQKSDNQGLLPVLKRNTGRPGTDGPGGYVHEYACEQPQGQADSGETQGLVQESRQDDPQRTTCGS